MKGIAALLALAGTLGAQVTIAHDLGPTVLEAARAALLAAVPQAEIRWQRTDADALEQRLRAGSDAPDVVFGVDALDAARLARAGVLRGEVRVPLRAPIVLAYAPAHWGDAPPRDWDDLLFDPRCEAQLVLGEPQVQPSLWAQLFAWQIGGGGLEQALTWLRTLDARRPRYCATRAERDEVWDAGGGRTLALLELGEVRKGAYRVPASGTAARGLALVLVRDSEAARAAAEHLASPAFALAMADAGLLSAAPGNVPERARDLARALWPPPAADPWPWFARWRADVRGRGAWAADVEAWLDAGLLVVFLVVGAVLYRSLQRTDPDA
jgi:hypothetical protein